MVEPIDVTAGVAFDPPDDELLSLRRCICGAEWGGWEVTLSIYPDNAAECPQCHRRFYFEQSIRVFQVDSDLASEPLEERPKPA